MLRIRNIREHFQLKTVELQQSLPLRVLGIAFSFCMILTYFYWQASGLSSLITAGNPASICWPFWQDCLSERLLTAAGVERYLNVFLFFAVFSILLFCRKSLIGYGYFTLFIAHAMKFFALIQDFQLMGNYHYMEFILFLVFFFVRSPALTLRFLIVSFYFFAGMLKLNKEWLSGSAIPDIWLSAESATRWLKGQELIQWATAYVVLLETVLIFGLLSFRRSIFWFIYLQVVVFHLFSFEIVGWFYPLTMLSLLLFLPLYLEEMQRNVIEAEGLPSPIQQIKSLRGGSLAALLLFAALQVYPKLLPGDPALTGEASVLKLNMIDAYSDCRSVSIAHFNDGKVQDISLRKEDFFGIVRIWCHPYVYYFRAKQWCKKFAELAEFERISLGLSSRRSHQKSFQKMIDLENVCSEDIRYNIFYNSWVRP